jgi:hypothetical protein
MMTKHDSWAEQVDTAFGQWEQLRQTLYRREQDWAAAVTRTGDRQRLGQLTRDIAQLQQAADAALDRAMCTVARPGRPLAG